MSEISDLFALDPLKLTRPDRDKIVAHYRANRQQFMLGVKKPKDEKPKAAAKPAKLGAADLAQIEIDI